MRHYGSGRWRRRRGHQEALDRLPWQRLRMKERKQNQQQEKESLCEK
jgi:hypothetical protein